MTERRRVRVVAALLPDPEDASRFLCQQRLPGVARGDLWEFPGGKVEPDEEDAAALVRELREELGVPVAVGSLLWTGSHTYPDLEVELALFAARLLGETPRALSAQRLAFCTLEEMQALPFCEADVPLIASLRSGETPTS